MAKLSNTPVLKDIRDEIIKKDKITKKGQTIKIIDFNKLYNKNTNKSSEQTSLKDINGKILKKNQVVKILKPNPRYKMGIIDATAHIPQLGKRFFGYQQLLLLPVL
jgi:hypothetical protein